MREQCHSLGTTSSDIKTAHSWTCTTDTKKIAEEKQRNRLILDLVRGSLLCPQTLKNSPTFEEKRAEKERSRPILDLVPGSLLYPETLGSRARVPLV